MSKINIAKYRPVKDIKGHLIFSNNGNVVACYRVQLPEIYSLSEKDFEDLHSNWFQAIKSLPVGTVVHKHDIYFKKSFTSENLPNDTFLSKATHDYFKGREHMEHHGYLFFTLTKNKQLNNPKYVNPFRKVDVKIPEVLQENLQRFRAAVNDSVSFINNGRKVSLIPLAEAEILNLGNAYFNGFNEGFDTAIELDKKNIQIGEHYFDVLAVNSERCFGEKSRRARSTNALPPMTSASIRDLSMALDFP